jgi:hypothetical protein
MYSEVEKAMARQKVAIEVSVKKLSRVLSGKLIVVQLLKKSPPFIEPEGPLPC